MPKRKKYIFLPAITLSILLVANILIYFFDIDGRIKQLITDNIKTGQPYEIEFSDIEYSYKSLVIKGFSYTSSELDTSSPELKIEYSATGLLWNLQDPLKSIRKIFIVDPAIEIKELSGNEDNDSNFELPRLPPGLKFSVFTSGLSLNTPLIDVGNISLRGILDNQSLEIDLSKAADPEDSLSFSLKAKLANDTIGGEFFVDSFEPVRLELGEISEYLQIKNGRIGANLKFVYKNTDFVIDGASRIGNLGIYSPANKSTLYNLTAEIIIDSNRISIPDTKFSLNGTQCSMRGSVPDIFNPVFDLELETGKVDIYKISQEEVLQGFIQTKGQLILKGSGISYSGTTISDEFIVDGEVFRDVYSKTEFNGSRLSFTTLEASYGGNFIDGYGYYDFDAGSFDFTAFGTDFELHNTDYCLDSLFAVVDMKFNIKMPENDIEIETFFDIKDIQYMGLPAPFDMGRATFNDKSMNLNIFLFDSGSSSKLDVQADLSGSKTLFGANYFLETFDIGFTSLKNLKVALSNNIINENISINSLFEIGNDMFGGNLAVSGKLLPDGVFNYVIRSVNTSIGNLPVNYNGSGTYESNAIRVNQFDISGFANITGTYNLETSEVDLMSEINKSNGSLFQSIIPGKISLESAIFDHRLNLSGKYGNLAGEGYITVDSLLINDIYYNLRTNIKIKDTDLILHESVVSQNGIPVIEGDFSYKENGDMHFLSVINGLDCNSLELFIPEIEIDGKLNGILNIDYENETLKFISDFRAKNLAADFLHFNKVRFEAAGNGNTIKISKFELEEKNNIFAGVSGAMPYHTIFPNLKETGEQIDIDLLIRDNFLSLLEKRFDIVQKARSKGEIKLKIKGSKTFYLDSGSIKTWDTSVLLDKYLAPVSDLSLDIDINNGNVYFNTFEGIIGDERFTITNTQNDSGNIRAIGLSIGHILLETGKDGLAFNIPGLMGEDSFGRANLRGNSKEKFSIYKKENSYIIDGIIDVFDTNLEYNSRFSERILSNAVKNSSLDIEYNIVIHILKGVSFSYGQILKSNISEGRISIITENGKEIVSLEAESESGHLMFYGHEFKPQAIRVSIYRNAHPEISGSWEKRLEDGTQIYLEVDKISENGLDKEAQLTLGDIVLRLSSDRYTTQEEILARLLYGKELTELDEAEKNDLAGKQIIKLISPFVEDQLIAPYIRSVTAPIREFLFLDDLEFRTGIIESLLESGYDTILSNGDGRFSNSRALRDKELYDYLIENFEFRMGKFISESWYLSYRGKVISESSLERETVDYRLNHEVSVEFFINKYLRLRYDYNILPQEGIDEQRISIESSVKF